MPRVCSAREFHARLVGSKALPGFLGGDAVSYGHFGGVVEESLYFFGIKITVRIVGHTSLGSGGGYLGDFVRAEPVRSETEKMSCLIRFSSSSLAKLATFLRSAQLLS